jgi:hypothetical protein
MMVSDRNHDSGSLTTSRESLSSRSLRMPHGAGGRQQRQTTPVHRTQPEKFRITHSFHPLSGNEFEALACQEYGGEQRVCSSTRKAANVRLH